MAERITDQDERDEEMRRAPKADPEDSDLRIDLSEGTDGATRIDWRDDAVVRPGKAEPREE
jgi:hypothetical protein